MEIAFYCLLAAAAAAGFLYLARVAARLPESAPRLAGFGVGDACLAALLASLITLLTISAFGQKQVVTPIIVTATIIQWLCIVTMILGFMIFRDRNPIVLFGLKWPGWPKGILFVFGALLAAFPIVVLTMLVPHFFGMKTEPQGILQYLQTATGSQRVTVILMATVISPAAEEIVFRGYLHGAFRKYIGRWPSILVVSAIFAVMHAHLPVLVPLFLLAIALSVVYERTGSLWAPILMHATFNTITVVSAFAWPDLVN